MRILVADQNALLLAAIAATFGRHCEIVTATRQDICMAHVAQHHFDVVVACDKLAGGYTGLELLSEVEAISPTTLRIFAARPETLKRLGKRLDLFGLLGTLHYPIEARKLLIALKVARTKLPGRPKPPKVKHVVLENEWDTGERLALLGQELEDAPTPAHAEPTAHEHTPLEHEYPATPGHAAVEQARHIAEASSFEVSFEVSFDENPSRYDLTGHGGKDPVAEAFAPEWVVPEEISPFEVSFDENPSPFAIATPVVIATPDAIATPVAVDSPDAIASPVAFTSDEPFEPAPSPANAAAAEDEPYLDSNAANDEIFFDEPAVPQAHRDTSGGNAPAAARTGASHETSAAAQRPTAYAAALAQSQQAAVHQTAVEHGNAQPWAPVERPTSPASTAAAHAGQRPGSARSNTPPATAKSPTPPKQSAAKGPRPRKPTVPTAMQREAFQRALARRNAARSGGFVEEPPIDFSSMASTSAAARPAHPTQSQMGSSSKSLSDLARMATTKRPLPGTPRRVPRRAGGASRDSLRYASVASQPKRRIFVVGSGIAAVLLAAVVCFELLRATPPGEHGRHGLSTAAQFFSPAPTLVADSSAGSPEVFTPAPPEPVQTAAAPGTDAPLPQPQTFDPDSAPPDPPPPPALEQPGPMEPPSMGHHRPPWVPQGGPDTE
jgi:hypothetical protein